MRALIVDVPQGCLSDTGKACLQVGWEITLADGYAAALDAAKSRSFDALFVPALEDDSADPGAPGLADRAERGAFDELIDLAGERRIPTLVMADPGAPGLAGYPEATTSYGHGQSPGALGSLVHNIARDVSPAELKGRLEMIERFHPVLRRMDRELDHMRNLTRRLDRQFREMDQEMRLAGRLQRDFLPKLDKPIRNTRFATVYRPTLWVSGDTFDVFRVNENLTAFYVADAVGHGMAASLLTMFIRRAIVAKQLTRNTGLPGGKTGLPGADGYRLLTPSETLDGLNTALIDQRLPNNQFVTACYMLIDHRTLTVQFASGGHPYPVVLSPDGSLRELEVTGALLGIFDGAEFPTSEAQLYPGDKLLIYTDGLEMAFSNPAYWQSRPTGRQGPLAGSSASAASYFEEFRSLAALPIQEMMRRLETKMDRLNGSLAPADDVTIVGLECLEN